MNLHINRNTLGGAITQASVFSLTGCSSGRQQAPLVGALRATRSGAAYRERVMNYFETLSVLIPWLALVIAIYTFFQQRKLQREANDLQRATSELATRQLQMLDQEKLERNMAKLSLVLVGTQGNHIILLSNTGIADATNVRIESLGSASPLVQHQISSLFPLERLRASEELRLGAAVYYESPPTFTLRLRWKNSDGSDRMEDFIISH